MLKEAVDLYVENARELDTLDSALEGLTSEHRWTTSFRVAV